MAALSFGAGGAAVLGFPGIFGCSPGTMLFITPGFSDSGEISGIASLGLIMRDCGVSLNVKLG